MSVYHAENVLKYEIFDIGVLRKPTLNEWIILDNFTHFVRYVVNI